MMTPRIKNCHEKIVESVKRMLIDIRYKMPFYGEFNLMVNFKEEQTIPTCGVNVTRKGMNFYYNVDFLNELATKDGVLPGKTPEEKVSADWDRQKQVNFIVLHEDFHLLFNHPKRTVSGRFDPYLSNIAQDMIINSIIWNDIDHNFVDIPKYPDTEKNRQSGVAGRNMALFLPKEYDGTEIFELLYVWLREKKEEYERKRNEQGNKNQCETCNGSGEKSNSKKQGQNPGDGDGDEPCPDCDGKGSNGKDQSGNPEYGPYGKSGDRDVDTHSLDSIFENMDKTQGQYMDVHVSDEIPEDLRDTMMKDVVERLRARGFTSASIESTLGKLQKKKKDYLKEIKRSISNEIMGTSKKPTITRPNRRGIKGIKGNRKLKTQINVLLDTSGSMSGLHEKVLNYVFQNDIEINLIQVDTKVHDFKSIKNKKELQMVHITGFGGTILQPGVDLVVEKYNRFNTVVLTDGYCDHIDFSQHRGRILVITTGDEVVVTAKPKKGVRQIKVDDSYN